MTFLIYGVNVTKLCQEMLKAIKGKDTSNTEENVRTPADFWSEQDCQDVSGETF